MEESQIEMPPAESHFILHRFNGDEVFPIASAVMGAYTMEEGVALWFEVAANPDGAQRCEDTTGMGHNTPRAEVIIDLPELDVSQLVGREFVMPGTQSDDEDSYQSLLYYFEHEPLRDNHITIVSQSDDHFWLRWTAVTPDPVVYDGSEPPTQVEVEGEFLFEDMEEWVCP